MINLKKGYFLFSYQMDFISFQIIQGDILQHKLWKLSFY